MSLPLNVHLLTFEPWKSNSILIRFEHIFGKDEDDIYSQDVSFNVQEVFGTFNIVSMRETTLSANQWLDEANRLNFTNKSDSNNETAGHEATERNISPKLEIPNKQITTVEGSDKNYTITLKPMEIRIFIVELNP